MSRFLELCAAVVGIMVLAVAPAAADDPAGLPAWHPWHGWKVGTWAETRETLSQGAETKMTQVKLILQNGDSGIDLRQYPMKDGKYDETAKVFVGPRRGVDLATDARAKLLGSRKGKRTIDGKEVECEIKQYSLSTGDGKPDARVELWHWKGAKVPVRRLEVDEAPFVQLGPDVVRAELVLRGKDVTETARMAVVSLKDSRKIGSKEYACVREEGEGTIEDPEGGGQGKITRWLSDEIPGRVACQIVEGEKGEKGRPMKFKAIEEVIAFGTSPAK